MKALYNNEWIENAIDVNLTDRALNFGDGLFETIIIRNAKPKFLDYHFERLVKGATILNLNLPWVNYDQLREAIHSFIQAAEIKESNFKLMVWRKSSNLGGYNFDVSNANFLFIHRPLSSQPKVIKKADFAESITFSYSQLSGIKTLNSLPYILASNEKRQRQLDEIIVLNSDGYICECSSSNLFWVHDGSFFTPPLKSGCLEGVMRRAIIEKFEQSGNNVAELLITKEELLKADTVFATNSTGIRFFECIAGKQFNTDLIDSDLLVI